MQVNQRNQQQTVNIGQQEQKTPKSEKRHQSTLIMMIGFFTIVSMGHFYCSLLIIVLTSIVFYEVNNLYFVDIKNQNLQISKLLSQTLYGIAMFFSFVQSLKEQIYDSKINILIQLYKYNQIILLGFVLLIFMFTIMNLRFEILNQQLNIFFRGGILTFLCFFVWQIWFFTAIILVIVNDMCAFLFGKLFGRHKLWKLSPKKTVEGFIGGAIGTCLLAIILAKLCSYDFMRPVLCPQPHLTLIPFSFPDCELPEMYHQKEMNMFIISQIIGKFKASQFTIHLTIIALISSLVAPFGGFMASAFKRNLKVKDFSNLIPGHGGVTDRVDCILINALFISQYCKQIIIGTNDF